VPVFGRGRALTALSGFEVSANVLSQAAAFLCGACSCEVKEMNPGKDLLLAANWEAGFTIAPASSDAPGTLSAPPSKTPPARAAHVPNEQRGMRLLATVTLAFVCIIVLLLGIAMLRSLRKQ